MFYYHQDFMETLVHQCANAKQVSKWKRQRMATVMRHDTRTYMLIAPCGNGRTEAEMVDVKFCPFCGVNLEEDEVVNERLKLELL